MFIFINAIAIISANHDLIVLIVNMGIIICFEVEIDPLDFVILTNTQAANCQGCCNYNY